MNRNAALQRRDRPPFGGWDFHANALTSPGADAPGIPASGAASKRLRDPHQPLEEFAWPRLKAIRVHCPPP